MTQQASQREIHVTPRTIALRATVVGSTVKVSGDGAAELAEDSGAHRFDFTIESPPGLKVEFASLDTQDDCSTCPPAPGENSKQIVGVRISKGAASFTNSNNNKKPMDVSYQWNFTCDDPSLTVESFDPIIKNGGTTTVSPTG